MKTTKPQLPKGTRDFLLLWCQDLSPDTLFGQLLWCQDLSPDTLFGHFWHKQGRLRQFLLWCQELSPDTLPDTLCCGGGDQKGSRILNCSTRDDSLPLKTSAKRLFLLWCQDLSPDTLFGHFWHKRGRLRQFLLWCQELSPDTLPDTLCCDGGDQKGSRILNSSKRYDSLPLKTSAKRLFLFISVSGETPDTTR
jgi:hypothetical protein